MPALSGRFGIAFNKAGVEAIALEAACTVDIESP